MTAGDGVTERVEAFRADLDDYNAILLKALADRLENEAAYEASRGDTWDATCIRAEARRIRKALNGETA